MKFPTILVINLDSRPDRWTYFQQDFAGWTYERVPGIRHAIAWKGCTLSHIRCLELAKQRNYDWALVLEDDCVLQPDAKTNLSMLLPILWNTRDQWDIFAGGIAVRHDSHTRIISRTPSLFSVSGSGSHFSLLHRDSITKVLNSIKKNPDDMIDQDYDCIDTWYSINMRVWTSAPYISIQRPGRSELLNTYKDSQALYLQSEKELIKLLFKSPPFAWCKR